MAPHLEGEKMADQITIDRAVNAFMRHEEIWEQPLGEISATALETLGALRYETDGRVYRYGQLIDQAGAYGEVVYPASAVEGEWKFTTDYTGGSGVTGKVAGVIDHDLAVFTENYYGWFQVGGFCPMVRTDAGVSAGDPLIGHTVDGEADTMGNDEYEKVFGFALADDTTINSQDACVAKLSGIL